MDMTASSGSLTSPSSLWPERPTKDKIKNICKKIENLLLEKNEKYGDSALRPTRLFSNANNIEQLKVRIDDKLSRIKTASMQEDEEVLLDLIGYLILLMIALEKPVNSYTFTDTTGVSFPI